MNLASFVRLVALSAIWGGSFLLTRICVPVIGPIPLIVSRVGLAALFLGGVVAALHRKVSLRRDWKVFVLLGVFNSALPFLLFAYAARTIPASLSSIINATSPIWGAVVGAVVSRRPLSAKSACGLALGVVGVGILVGFDASALRPGAGFAIALALLASLCYGVASIFARPSSGIDPMVTALGSMTAATVVSLPALAFAGPVATPPVTVVGLLLVLGIVCSGLAYLLYFRLIADIGAAPALTVTFLVPVFGVLWGRLFLAEPIGAQTLIGGATVIAGTVLVTGFSLRSLRSAAAAA